MIAGESFAQAITEAISNCSCFLPIITEGRKPGGNFVLVVTDSVYREIISSDKKCPDERYCGYRIIKKSEYEDTLLRYLS